MSRTTRRAFLGNTLFAMAGVAGSPLLLAAAPGEARFAFVILRGALDGLAAVPAYGDAHYAAARGALSIPTPGSQAGGLKLDGLFALHPALSKLHARYAAKELLVVHAVASPYRDRSHFDAQDLLENGTATPQGARDGWLNRALSIGLPQNVASTYAMAFADTIPLVLQGARRVASWAPSRLSRADDDTLQRLKELYASDAYFATRLDAALATDAMAGEQSTGDRRGSRNPLSETLAIARMAGQLLREKNGARIAVMEVNGWDTHANQGAAQGVLATRLGALDTALDALRVELQDAWQHTVVLVATEFGRTVAVNGTRGTDHGTASAALLVGGAVQGGRILADWPGLASKQLYQGRDLMPTTDLRSLCKGVLIEHLGLREAVLSEAVFPQSQNAKPLLGLVRST